MTDCAHDPSRRRLLCFYSILLICFVGYGASKIIRAPTNSPLDWVSSEFKPRKAYDQLVADFGTGDILIVTWQDCVIDSPKVDAFTESLRRSPGFFVDDVWLFEFVSTANQRMDELTGPPVFFSTHQAKERLPSFLLGGDGDTTSILVGFTPEGVQQRRRLVPLIRAAAIRFGGADAKDIHLAGPVIDGYEVDRASQWAMTQCAPISSVIVLVVCVLCLDSIYVAGLVFGVATAAQMVSLALVYYTGGTMTALLVVLPSLTQVLAIAAGMHLVHYVADSTDAANKPWDWNRMVSEGVRIGWVPCVLSAVTTAIGLGSLAASGLESVRQFGVYAAFSVCTTCGLVLFLIPRGLRFGKKFNRRFCVRKRVDGWNMLLGIQLRYRWGISTVAILLAFVAIQGISKLKASVQISTLFSSQSRLLQDYSWIEKHLGPTVPIDFLVDLKFDTTHSFLSDLEEIRSIKKELLRNANVSQVLSCLDLLPESDGIGTVETRNRVASGLLTNMEIGSDPSFDAQLHDSRIVKEEMIKSGYLRFDGAKNRYRLTAYLSALGGQDYSDILEQLREKVSGITEGNPRISFEVSGVMPLVQGIQHQLLSDLHLSFVGAFVLIAMVMTVLRAGVFEGLIAMIPNVFPSLVLFGILGWLDYEIDIGTMMTASIAMGVAVDDTMHFLTNVDRQVQSGESLARSLATTYRRCGGAVIQTTLVCCAGLSVFALSDFLPTARFAWMMIILLLLALIGDLVILPAILLAFKDRWVKRIQIESVA